MLVYNDLISRVLSVVPVGQCLSNPFLKSKQSLAICEIIDGSLMIRSISDMLLVWRRGQQQWGVLQQLYFPPYYVCTLLFLLFHYCVCVYVILEASKDLRFRASFLLNNYILLMLKLVCIYLQIP